MSSTGTDLWPFATQTFRRRPGIETRPTTESAPSTQQQAASDENQSSNSGSVRG